MSHVRKGTLTASKEWAAHLRPYWKRQFWRQERRAEQEDIEQRLEEDRVQENHEDHTRAGGLIPRVG
jgi:hypothetical protein